MEKDKRKTEEMKQGKKRIREKEKKGRRDRMKGT